MDNYDESQKGVGWGGRREVESINSMNHGTIE